MQLELFHQIAQPESAEVRRFISEHGLSESVRLRNVTYEEVRTDFASHGGKETPSIWDGEHLHAGRDACLALLRAVASS
jgi:hypothetical protein